VYQYRALVTDVHDGDTFTLNIDLGLCVVLVDQKLRLAHANAPELATAEGKAARAWVLGVMPVGTAVTVDTVKAAGDKEKFGRWLAQVTLPDGSDLATVMIATDHAVPYEGGAR
jgi:endonuclease YncB( thermonuclease family)